MNGAPLPDFTAIVRTVPYEQLPTLRAALAEADARTIARMVEEGTARSRKGIQTSAVRWGNTIMAARMAGLLEKDEKNKTTIRRARQLIAAWARNQAWASRPTKRTLQIDLDAFGRWLELKKGIS